MIREQPEIQDTVCCSNQILRNFCQSNWNILPSAILAILLHSLSP
jgi:hypothetical protein